MEADDRPRIAIAYCRRCGFTARALWIAQELLAAFDARIEAVELRPSGGGIFAVLLDGETVFSNRDEGRFPEPRELKEALAARLGASLPERHQGAGGPPAKEAT